MPQRDEISVKLLGRPLLLARLDRLACLNPQPTRQLLGIRVQLAWPVGLLENRLHRIGTQIFADRVARQAGTPLDLVNGYALPKMPAADQTE